MKQRVAINENVVLNRGTTGSVIEVDMGILEKWNGGRDGHKTISKTILPTTTSTAL